MTRVPLPETTEATETLEALPGLSPSLDLSALDVIRAQANNPAVLAAVLEYVGSLYEQLPEDTRELVILAVAREKRSAYEWHQHVPVAQDAGVPIETIRAIGRDAHDDLSVHDRIVVEFVQAQCRGEVTDERYASFADRLPVDDIVAVSRLAANYAGTADFIAAMDLSVEDEFVGWTPRE